MQLQRPALLQEQRQKMNQQLIQSIKLMEMPIAELREKIEEEAGKNPALEILGDPTLVSLENTIKYVKDEDNYFETSSDSGFSGSFAGKAGTEAADEKHRFIEGVVSRPETLQEHLLWQLRLESTSKDIQRIGDILIQNLDSDGFHREPLEKLLAGEDQKLIEEALALVQSLEPRGCCTIDFKESLRVQIKLLEDAPAGMEKVLDHLQLLERGKFTELAKKTGQTESELQIILEQIKKLSPYPGRSYATAFAAAETRFVVPDIEVIRKENGEFAVILNSEEIPVLGVNPFFLKISKEKDKSARNFVRDNIKEARWFIQSINERNHTLLRVTRAIVVFQSAFFAKGPKFLAPLTQRNIAKELEINESTVSRTVNGKYAQTEWGIFELRYFFSNSISGTGSTGSKYSKESVKEILRELISDKKDRLSDQKITELLAEKGIPLARRTVAKYRKELEDSSSHSRNYI